MNVPNALTLLRIFFVPLLVAALVQQNLKLHLASVRHEDVHLKTAA